MKIGILVTATWRFIDFFPRLMASLNNFCPGHERTIFLFTDNGDNFPGVVKILIDHTPFPAVTLERYERYIEYQYVYDDQDYLFHIDADMRVVGVGDEILNHISAIKHPLFYMGGGSWEGRDASLAYVPSQLRAGYYCGGIQGGTVKDYLDVCWVLAERIKADRDFGIMAEWHDESHWNWWLAHNPGNFNALDPGYCYPEEKSIPFEKKIIALDKDKKVYRQ